MPLVFDPLPDSPAAVRAHRDQARRAVPLLPALFEAFTAAHHRPRHWAQLPVNVRGDVRAIWASVRAGQTDPWLAALTGWRHRATWHRYTRPLPTLADLDDAPTTWAADHRATAREIDHDVAGQYLALACHLINHHAATRHRDAACHRVHADPTAHDWSDPAVSRGFTSKPISRPDTFNRIPTQVAGMPVLAAVPDGDSDSNRVYVIALDGRREGRPYVVFTTWWDGERWQASNGHYDVPMSKALGVLTERLGWEVRATAEATAGGGR